MKTQHAKWSTALFCTVLLAGAGLAMAGATGEATKAQATPAAAPVPKAVTDALKAKFPHAMIDKQSKEKEGGVEVWDLEFRQEGTKYEADISAAGMIHNWEKAIKPTELPPTVSKAVEAKYPNATFKEVMVVTDVKAGKDVLQGYEIQLAGADKKEVEVTVAPDGKFIEEPGAEKYSSATKHTN
jgi:putative PepSY-like beta-lactamase-inhibitor